MGLSKFKAQKKVKKPRYERKGCLTNVQDILKAIRDSSITTISVLGVTVNVTSLRLQTFACKGLVCSVCGQKGSFFAVERNFKNKDPDTLKGWHLNLWGINQEQEEVLMTHDHTLARALGGKDELNNTSTMCEPCNHLKGIEEKRLVEAMREAEK